MNIGTSKFDAFSLKNANQFLVQRGNGMGGKQIELSVKKVLGHLMIVFGVLFGVAAFGSKAAGNDIVLGGIALIVCGVYLSQDRPPAKWKIVFGVLFWVVAFGSPTDAAELALGSMALIGCGVYLSQDRPPAKGKPGSRLWRVTGIDTHTGQRISREIEAESRATAVSLATLDGVDVETADRSDARTESHPGHTGSE